MRFKRKNFIALILALAMMVGFSLQSEAVTIRYRVRVTVRRKTTVTTKNTKKKATSKKSSKKYHLDAWILYMYKGDEVRLDLVDEAGYIAGDKAKVQWTVLDKNLAKIEPHGSHVIIKSKNKKGKTKIIAKYNGKTYTCLLYCYKGLDNDIIALISPDPDDEYLTPIIIKQGSTRTEEIFVIYYLGLVSRDSPNIYCRPENPNIVTCDADDFVDWDEDEDGEDLYWTAHITIRGLNPGTTRIRITNDYNNEVEYIPVTVVP